MHMREEIQRKQKRSYSRNMTSTLRQHHEGKVLNGFSRVAAGTWGIFLSYSGDVHLKL